MSDPSVDLLLQQPDFAAARPLWLHFKEEVITTTIVGLLRAGVPVTVQRVNTLLMARAMTGYAYVASDVLDAELRQLLGR